MHISRLNFVVTVFLIYTIVTICHVTAQPFIKEIMAFQKQDSMHFPAKNSILFIGSSSFTYWKNLQESFPDKPILNRAFGGSTLLDVIRYVPEIIQPYYPKQIVIYCGENDIAASDTVTAKIVLSRFKTLFYAIRSLNKKIPIAFVSIKPSPARWKMNNRMQQSNTLIQQFLSTQKRTNFIHVWPLMLSTNGYPNSSIFLKDSLHMNAEGYKLWQPLIAKALK